MKETKFKIKKYNEFIIYLYNKQNRKIILWLITILILA